MTLVADDDIAGRSPAFHDRRRFGRRAAFKRSKICRPGEPEINCIVIDLSDGGARIRLIGDVDLPSSFDLLIPEDDFIVTCEIAHRTGATAGVRFLRAPRRLSWVNRKDKGGLTEPSPSGKSEP